MKKIIFLVTIMPVTIQSDVMVDWMPAIIKFSKKGDRLQVWKLIESGANVNAKDYSNNTALIWALCKGHVEIARFLIEKGADVDARGTTTALIMAAAFGHKEILKLLIDKGADVNLVSPGGVSALMLAAYMGELEAVKILLDKGANFDLKDRSGITALMMARQKQAAKLKKRMEIVRLLVDAGAGN
jgi:uncharacterized protein